eukprot:433216-Pelagomonas_calceolata.AAC.1
MGLGEDFEGVEVAKGPGVELAGIHSLSSLHLQWGIEGKKSSTDQFMSASSRKHDTASSLLGGALRITGSLTAHNVRLMCIMLSSNDRSGNGLGITYNTNSPSIFAALPPAPTSKTDRIH